MSGSSSAETEQLAYYRAVASEYAELHEIDVPGRDELLAAIGSFRPTEDKFASFWSLVADALGPGGRVFFFDDNDRPAAELIEGAGSTTVKRLRHDGSPFRVIKIPYEPADLEQRLRDLHWDISVTATSGPFFWGAGGR